MTSYEILLLSTSSNDIMHQTTSSPRRMVQNLQLGKVIQRHRHLRAEKRDAYVRHTFQHVVLREQVLSLL